MRKFIIDFILGLILVIAGIIFFAYGKTNTAIITLFGAGFYYAAMYYLWYTK